MDARFLPYIVIANFALVSILLLVLGKVATARPLTELPGGIQNAAEMVLDWFVDQARKIDPGSVRLIAPFLATLFLLILFSNLLAILPIPILQVPPTSYFSGPFGLALVAVIGVIVVSARINGAGAALKHFVWPNPLQLVAEVSHTLSLSLRLYGNIGGELIVASLAAQAVPYGIPLLVHTLGLIPAVVQPIVFTLLTVNYLATAARGGGVSERRRGGAKSPEVQARPVLGIARAR